MEDQEIEKNKMDHIARPIFDDLDIRNHRPSIEDRPEAFRDTSYFTRLEEKDEEKYQEVMEALETVLDPELGIDIVNLGLIYDVLTDENLNVFVRMTLTTPFCPLSDHIIEMVEGALDQVDGLNERGVELVFEPAWHPEMLSHMARIALGFAKR